MVILICIYVNIIPGSVDEVAMGSEWIWESLVAVLTCLRKPPFRAKVISILCIDEKHFSKAGQVFKRQGKQLEMLSGTVVRS